MDIAAPEEAVPERDKIELGRKNSHGEDMPSLDGLNVPVEVPVEKNQLEPEVQEVVVPNATEVINSVEIIENKPADVEVIENKTEEVVVSKDVEILEKNTEEVSVENKMEEVTNDVGIIENKMEDVVIIENKMDDEVIIENKMDDEVIIENKMDDEVIIETKMDDEVIIENKMDDEVIVENKMEDEVIIENNTEEVSSKDVGIVENSTEVSENVETIPNVLIETPEVEEISDAPNPSELQQQPTATLSEIAKVDIKDPSDVEEIQEYQIPEEQTVIEEENSIQIITPDNPPIEEVEETHEVAPTIEEANLTNVEYGVILNDNQTMNGVHELTKELQDNLYESSEEIKVDQDAHMEDIVTIANEVQNEVTLGNVEIIENHPEEVITEDSVILPEEQVIIMETEEYDQPESIEVNVLEHDKLTPEEALEEAEEEADAKSPSSNIPCHVLGRSVDNPLVDPVRNGRVLLKPRLGVKIPYRNLTSQIVSKQEIAEEIMERSRLRQSAADPPVGGDVFFAKKLTQRLAKKLVPPAKPKSSKTSPSTSTNKKPPIQNPDPPEKIMDNSDLIALLEGDDVPDWNMPTKSTEAGSSIDVKRSSDWEREIALKQLKELPKHSRGGGGKSSHKYYPSKEDVRETRDPKVVKEVVKEAKEAKDPKNGKDDLKDAKDDEEKDDLNIQPRFSSNTVVKTYTRKRKPFPEELKALTTPIQKKSEEKAVPALTPLVPKSPKGPATTTVQKSPTVSKSTEKSQKTPTSSKKPVEDKKEKEKTVPEVKEKKGLSQEKKASVQEKKTPVQEKKSVVQEKKTPVQEKKSAVQEKKTPVQEKKLVVQEKKTPVQEKKALVQEKKTPVQEKKAVVQEKKTPVQEKKPVVQEKKTPVQEKKVLVEETKPLPQEKRRASTRVETPPPSIEPKKALSPNTYISKSSRIVKRKKIWDPDEATPIFKQTIKSPKLTETPDKPPPKLKPISATILKPNNEKSSPKLEPATPKPKPPRQMAILKPLIKKAKKAILKKPKRLTEVDRLLMDEGAVNLLYSVRNTEEIQKMKRKKKNKTLISIDRAQRELQDKTNEIKNDLQINSTKDSPISLRKKDGTPKTSPIKDLAASVLHRKKSKDSVSGSVHSPPASPGFASYSQHADASRIIRRHSSSSFSSDEDDEDEDEEEDSGTEEKPVEKRIRGEPQKKKAKLNHEKQGKGSIGVDKQVLNQEMSKNFNKQSDDPKYSDFETFSVRKFDNLVQIILASTSANGQTTLSVKGLCELAEVLKLLQKDDTCRVVVISSSGSSFCEGIDYKELASDDKPTRQSLAINYAAAVKQFLMALSKFTKLLVAGVHGNAVGLGVTMLPLFDMVLASDTATFSTPYARLGCAAEGGVLLTLPHVMHNALASELFFASRKLTAAEALRLGLVTRTLWPDKFQEELISALKLIASQSLQSMQAIKKQLRHHLLLNVEASLKSESSILIEHWTSNECQINFSNYTLENK